MIKILHSADWHLDAPMHQATAGQTQLLRDALAGIPQMLADACLAHSCDLVLLSGDLFDGAWNRHTVATVKQALERMAVPVFIAPGNHDYVTADSPWLTGQWPENVHIFTRPVLEAVEVPDLSVWVYGAGYQQMDCPGLLEGFSAAHTGRYALGVLHGDATQKDAPYCPVTARQVADSGLDYLALGHTHKADAFRAGKTLCGWPGCPMGRGFDETGPKGYYIVTLDTEAQVRFYPLDTPGFYALTVTAEQSVHEILPATASRDFYRVTLTGAGPADPAALKGEFPHLPNLTVRDHTIPPTELWADLGQDTLEGVYFQLLKDAIETAGPEQAADLLRAATISRQLLDGQEVVLP